MGVRPKVSVIMANYNSEKYIEKSMRSVLNQTFKSIELIIIDDCSKDQSKKIVKKLMKEDPRIKLIEQRKNQGAASARNVGLKIARGDYIIILDSDDIAEKNRVELQYNFLEKNENICIVGSSATIIDEKGNKIGIFKKFNNPKKIKKKLEKNNTIVHPSIMFRNNCHIYYREKFKTSEDYDMYLRVISENKKITNLENALTRYRINRNSLMSTNPNQKIYFDKAKEFYFQRKSDNKDQYNKFISPKIKKNENKLNKAFIETIIISKLLDGQGYATRKNIRNFIDKYGLNRKMIIFYLLSFIPKKIVWQLQKIM